MNKDESVLHTMMLNAWTIGRDAERKRIVAYLKSYVRESIDKHRDRITINDLVRIRDEIEKGV